jgi:hypothetical protein
MDLRKLQMVFEKGENEQLIRKVGENIQALLQQSSNLMFGSIPVGAYACTARTKPSTIQ